MSDIIQPDEPKIILPPSYTLAELERAELARRTAIAGYKQRPVLTCDFVFDAEERSWMPKPWKELEAAGIGWGQIADRRCDGAADAQLIYLRAAAPAAVRSMRGVAVEDALRLDYDALLPPKADQVSGHFSYAHTTQFSQDLFNHSNDPLALHADWTLAYEVLSGGSYGKSDGAKLVSKAPGAAGWRGATWLHDNMGVTDYSVHTSNMFSAYSTGQTIPILVARDDGNGDNHYRIGHNGNNNVRLRKAVGGIDTTLATDNIVAQNKTARIELVGTGPTLLKRYYDEVDLDDPAVSDSEATLQITGHAGVGMWLGPNAGDPCYTTDYTVYTAASPTTSPSASVSASLSASPTTSPSASVSSSSSASVSASPSASLSASPTASVSASPSASPSASVSSSPSASLSASPTTSVSASSSASVSSSPSASPSASLSASPTASISASPSTSVSSSPSVSPSASLSASPSASLSASPTASVSTSPSASVSASPSASLSASPTASPSASVSASLSASPTTSPSASPSASPSTSVSVSPSASLSASPTASPSASLLTLELTHPKPFALELTHPNALSVEQTHPKPFSVEIVEN